MAKKRVMVALSGGVDSSVAALILKKAGYEVVGLTMLLWSDGGVASNVTLLEQVCHILDIQMRVIDVEKEFKRYVIDYFCREYMKGRTPNPCVACNKNIKFGFLLDYTISSGFDYVATGHYARVEKCNEAYHLLKGLDRNKDQSYMLYTLGQNKLKHILFPLGEYSKAEVRRLAKQSRLPNADRPASQDLCFITSDYRSFLRRYLQPARGMIIDSCGKVVGEHEGVMFYTVGQRHKLGLATGEPVYVVKIDAANNTLVVGREQELYRSRCMVTDVNWVSGEAPKEPVEVVAKIRYKSPEEPAVLYPGKEMAEVVFRNMQRAITPGQAVVFYCGDEVIGGGTIDG